MAAHAAYVYAGLQFMARPDVARVVATILDRLAGQPFAEVWRFRHRFGLLREEGLRFLRECGDEPPARPAWLGRPSDVLRVLGALDAPQPDIVAAARGVAASAALAASLELRTLTAWNG